MTVDISNLSSSELKKLIESANEKLIDKAEAEKSALREEVESLVKARGFTMAELFGNSKTTKPKTKLAPTHRDPVNHENTWTGRGRQPKWLVKALEGGGSIEDYKIKP
jgi:DNA-binding protein H-NS